MKKIRFTVNRKVWIGTIAVVLSVMGVGPSVFFLANRQIEAYSWEADAYKVVAQVRQVETGLLDMVGKEQTYVITGESADLHQYQGSKIILSNQIEILQQMVSSSAEQKSNIESLVSAVDVVRDRLDRSVKVRGEIGFDAARELVISGVTGSEINEVNIIMAKILSAEEDNLSQKQAEVEKRARYLFMMIIAGTIAVSSMAIITGLMIVFSVTRPLVRLTQVIDSISKGNLAVKVDEKILASNDEVGDLARSFDRTMVSLKLAMRSEGETKNEN